MTVSGTDILVDGRKVATVAEAMATQGDLIAPLKAELDLLASRHAAAQGERGADQGGHDHGRQGHPVQPAAQGDVHRGARQLQRRVVRGAQKAGKA